MDPQDYERFPGFDADPRSRHWNLWTYIDARDGAQAIRLALEVENSAAPRSSASPTPTRSCAEVERATLLDKVYPNTKRMRKLKDNESLISIDKARSVLGYKPQYSWRQHVEAMAASSAAAGKKGKK